MKKKDAKQIMGEGDIKNIMDSSDMNYEYIQINLIKKEEVADSILYIFMESSKEDSSIKESKIDKNEKQAHSCDVF